jgi:ketosteroid isomerase-like protein
MSGENVRTIRECFRIFNEQGIQAALDAFGHLLDPDFRLEEAPAVPDRERHAGREGFVANLAKLEESFEELRLEPLELLDLDNKVLVVVALSGRGRGSDVPVQGSFVQVWTLRDGKAVSLRDYATKAEALEAAGLQE